MQRNDELHRAAVSFKERLTGIRETGNGSGSRDIRKPNQISEIADGPVANGAGDESDRPSEASPAGARTVIAEVDLQKMRATRMVQPAVLSAGWLVDQGAAIGQKVTHG